MNTNSAASSKKHNFPVLLIFVIAIGAYLVYFLFGFLSKTQFNYVLAEEGTVENSFSARAVIIREETAVYSSSGGIVMYSHNDGSKLKADSVVCTIIENDRYGDVLSKKLAGIYDELDESVDSSSIAGLSEVEGEMQVLLAKYQAAKRQNNYALLYSLENEMEKLSDYRRGLYILSNDSLIISLLAEENIFLDTQSASRRTCAVTSPGILEYRADGFEGWTSDDIDYSFFSGYDGEYSYPDMTIHEIRQGILLYRLITSQTWQLNLYVNRDQVTYFSNHKAVEFLFNGNERLSAKVIGIHTEDTNDGTRYKVTLELSERMEAHANERFATLTFVEEITRGIKLSESCIAEESYYVLPTDYLIINGSRKGVYVENAEGKITFAELSGVLQSEDGKNFYFRLTGREPIRVNSFVVAPNGHKMVVAETAMIKGVYIVNTGEPIFTPVTVLAQDNGYVLVSGLIKSDRVQLHK